MINFDEMLLGKIDGIRRGGRATKPPRIMTKCNFAWGRIKNITKISSSCDSAHQ